MDRKIIATELYKIAKKISQNTVNEDELIDELTGISREFSSENISEIIPINFDSSSVSGIDTLLNNYQSFLAKKGKWIVRPSELFARIKKVFANCKEVFWQS